MGSIDIIKLLKDKLMTHIIRQIFSQLDEETIRQAELVSKAWWQVISEECIWKFVLGNKILDSPLWEKYVRRRDIKWQTGLIGQECHFYFKNIYKTIKEELVKIERNWITSNYTFRIIDCGMDDGEFRSVYNEKYIANGMLDYTVKLWNNRTLECEKVFRGHENAVSCFHIDHNFLITGSYDKTIKVWDLETTELLNSVGDSFGALQHLKFKNGYLISASVDFASGDYCLTVRQMSDPQNISVGTCVALNAVCLGVDLNEKYIVVPMDNPLHVTQGPRYPADIRLYSLSTLEVVRTLNGVAAGYLIASSWHLLGNFIIVGGDDKEISFWDIDTGERKRAIKYDDDTQMVVSGFNDKYLVTGYYSGDLNIWDLQAAIDLKNADSYPFLLGTLKTTHLLSDIIMDDFQIIAIYTAVKDPRVYGGWRSIHPMAAIWDFVPSPVRFLPSHENDPSLGVHTY